mmetsp:Transcript_26461/g.46666  ORF Transcript_26461/g.46666 Transcript_26461/m.46666 type:complete len:295 (+) Transcript_26461:1196-2080(+)
MLCPSSLFGSQDNSTAALEFSRICSIAGSTFLNKASSKLKMLIKAKTMRLYFSKAVFNTGRMASEMIFSQALPSPWLDIMLMSRELMDSKKASTASFSFRSRDRLWEPRSWLRWASTSFALASVCSASAFVRLATAASSFCCSSCSSCCASRNDFCAASCFCCTSSFILLEAWACPFLSIKSCSAASRRFAFESRCIFLAFISASMAARAFAISSSLTRSPSVRFSTSPDRVFHVSRAASSSPVFPRCSVVAFSKSIMSWRLFFSSSSLAAAWSLTFSMKAIFFSVLVSCLAFL